MTPERQGWPRSEFHRFTKGPELVSARRAESPPTATLPTPTASRQHPARHLPRHVAAPRGSGQARGVPAITTNAGRARRSLHSGPYGPVAVTRAVSYNFCFAERGHDRATAGTGPAEFGRSSAPVAQLVEQRIRNAKVGGSTPSWGTRQTATWRATRRSCSNPATQFAKPEAVPQAASGSMGFRRMAFRHPPKSALLAAPCPSGATDLSRHRLATTRGRPTRRSSLRGICVVASAPPKVACPNASAHPRPRIVTAKGPHDSATDRSRSAGTFRRSEGHRFGKLPGERHFVDFHQHDASTLRAESKQQDSVACVRRRRRSGPTAQARRSPRRQGPSVPAKAINARRRF
jgi:hypothetical protein